MFRRKSLGYRFNQGGDVVTAEPVVVLDGIPQPTERDLREDPSYGAYSSMPTAFDIHGRDAVVVTYKEALSVQAQVG